MNTNANFAIVGRGCIKRDVKGAKGTDGIRVRVSELELLSGGCRHRGTS